MNRAETNEERGLAWLEGMRDIVAKNQDTVETADLILELIQVMRPFMKCSHNERSKMMEDLQGLGYSHLQLAFMEHLLFGHELKSHHFQHPFASFQQLYGAQAAA